MKEQTKGRVRMRVMRRNDGNAKKARGMNTVCEWDGR
jgi:hypothetical protein